MYLARFLIILVIIYYVDCRNHVKALTDSLGQEVIEIGTPIKDLQELPPGVEEEPSAEVEETRPPSARRETKKVQTTSLTTAKPKEVDKEDTASQEEEEARIEKELAEIYKDTDYKSDNAETKKVVKEKIVETNVTDDKPIARSRINFKFQPDVNNRQDIERFRTSVDEISCDRRVTQRLQGVTDLSDEASKSTSKSEFIMSFIQMGSVVLSLFVCY